MSELITGVMVLILTVLVEEWRWRRQRKSDDAAKEEEQKRAELREAGEPLLGVLATVIGDIQAYLSDDQPWAQAIIDHGQDLRQTTPRLYPLVSEVKRRDLASYVDDMHNFLKKGDTDGQVVLRTALDFQKFVHDIVHSSVWPDDFVPEVCPPRT